MAKAKVVRAADRYLEAEAALEAALLALRDAATSAAVEEGVSLSGPRDSASRAEDLLFEVRSLRLRAA